MVIRIEYRGTRYAMGSSDPFSPDSKSGSAA
jgi:hypothetical protein